VQYLHHPLLHTSKTAPFVGPPSILRKRATVLQTEDDASEGENEAFDMTPPHSTLPWKIKTTTNTPSSIVAATYFGDYHNLNLTRFF
jgi:hypothetical protein